MTQPFFVVDLAHSFHGSVKRIHVTYKTLYYGLAIAGLFAVVGFAFLSSYVQMSWKVSHYNELRADLDQLRNRYAELQRLSRQRTDQLATLQTLASEVSVAYGLQPKSEDAEELASANPLMPTVKDTIETYNFLRSANISDISHHFSRQWQVNTQPSLWPVEGLVRSSYGGRADPFSGEGAFHKGLDIAAISGTPVHVAADGVVERAEWGGGYGKLVVIDHGGGIKTYYAHLSAFMVVPGLEVRKGQTIALSGGTGHATGPHLHYEVRIGGVPVNPQKYLAKSRISMPTKPAHSDLGL